MLYQVSIEDIRQYKNQQWRMSNYALLLMAGTGYLNTNIKLLSSSDVFMLNIFIGLVAVCTVIFIWFTQNNIIENYRKRVVKSHKNLSDKFKESCELDYDKYLSWLNGIEYVIALSLTIIAAGGALIWLVKPPF